MPDGVKETCCTNCLHLAVCKYKGDFLNIYETVLNASIHSVYILALNNVLHGSRKR